MSIKKMFEKVMSETACDMAEVLFKSEKEKKCFIQESWYNYGEDVEEHIFRAVENDFDKKSEEEQKQLVVNAIKDNFESIFDKSFDE